MSLNKQKKPTPDCSVWSASFALPEGVPVGRNCHLLGEPPMEPLLKWNALCEITDSGTNQLITYPSSATGIRTFLIES